MLEGVADQARLWCTEKVRVKNTQDFSNCSKQLVFKEMEATAAGRGSSGNYYSSNGGQGSTSSYGSSRYSRSSPWQPMATAMWHSSSHGSWWPQQSSTAAAVAAGGHNSVAWQQEATAVWHSRSRGSWRPQQHGTAAAVPMVRSRQLRSGDNNNFAAVALATAN